MGQVRKEYFEPGEVTKASDVNNAYSGIATAPGSIDQENTRNEWVSHYHISNVTNITAYAQGKEDVGNNTTYNSATWVDVDQTPGGGALISLSPNVTLNEGDIMRIHANVYIEDISLNDRRTDYYWFRFNSNMSINGAASADVPLGLQWGYSMTNGDRNEANPYTVDIFEEQREGFSWCHICTNTTELINNVRLQTQIEDALSSYEIKIASLYVIIQRR